MFTDSIETCGLSDAAVIKQGRAGDAMLGTWMIPGLVKQLQVKSPLKKGVLFPALPQTASVTWGKSLISLRVSVPRL